MPMAVVKMLSERCPSHEPYRHRVHPADVVAVGQQYLPPLLEIYSMLAEHMTPDVVASFTCEVANVADLGKIFLVHSNFDISEQVTSTLFLACY